MEKLEAYNQSIRNQFIAKSLKTTQKVLDRQSFAVSTSEDKSILVVTFIQTTDKNFLKRLEGYDGSTTFKIRNTPRQSDLQK